jgi:hypothetical protein
LQTALLVRQAAAASTKTYQKIVLAPVCPLDLLTGSFMQGPQLPFATATLLIAPAIKALELLGEPWYLVEQRIGPFSDQARLFSYFVASPFPRLARTPAL